MSSSGSESFAETADSGLTAYDLLTALQKRSREDAKRVVAVSQEWDENLRQSVEHYWARSEVAAGSEWKGADWGRWGAMVKDETNHDAPVAATLGILAGAGAVRLTLWTLPRHDRSKPGLVLMHPKTLRLARQEEFSGSAYSELYESLKDAAKWAQRRSLIDQTFDYYLDVATEECPIGLSLGSAWALLFVLARFPWLARACEHVTTTGEVKAGSLVPVVVRDKLEFAKTALGPQCLFFVPENTPDVDPCIRKVSSLDELLDQLLVLRLESPLALEELEQVRRDEHPMVRRLRPAFEVRQDLESQIVRLKVWRWGLSIVLALVVAVLVALTLRTAQPASAVPQKPEPAALAPAEPQVPAPPSSSGDVVPAVAVTPAPTPQTNPAGATPTSSGQQAPPPKKRQPTIAEDLGRLRKAEGQ